ncbi:restriction endonuclease subunit S [Xenorhabdus indica]|uniref:restriction endonuclease subunit S n=1 Tax=Xenorhabdus indica TaxID=333964 RepID=UPI00165755B6|nr:putative restriction modification enzyme S subunit [Xenorhabdus indica]
MSWPQAKLDDVISFIRGVTFKPDDLVEPLSSNSTVVMRTKNVQVEGLEQSDLIAIPSELVKRKEQALCEGDILISSANSWELVGKASYVPKLNYQATAGGFISIVRAKQRVIDSRYLYHWISSPSTQHKIRHCGRQTTNISNLDVGRFKDLEIPLPPLAEQKRIASILDKADAIRRKRQQAIQLADEFLRAVFLDMFGDPVTNPKGWEVRPLVDGIKSIISGWSAKGESYPCNEGEYGVLKISAVTSGKFNPQENKFVYEKDIPADKKLVFPKKGDLLFSRANTRDLVAATCIVPKDNSNVFLPDKLWNVKTSENILLPEYLNYLIWEPRFKEKLTSQATGTSGSMLNISKGKFETTDAIFPDLPLQKKFRSIYWGVQKYIDSLNASLDGCDASFSSLSQKAFSG